MRPKLNKWWLAFSIVFLLLVFLGPVLYVKTSLGYVAEVGLMLSALPFFYLFALTSRKMRKRFSTNTKATTEELKREDDVLLQSTALSQSVFFIYLNLIPTSRLIDILKWTVPTVAILFYTIRAYAKVKDNARYRYYSVFVLVLILIETASFVLAQIVPAFYIEEHNVVTFYTSFTSAGLSLLFLNGSSDALKRRYDYVKLKK